LESERVAYVIFNFSAMGPSLSACGARGAPLHASLLPRYPF
jgi:hypothetical protein